MHGLALRRGPANRGEFPLTHKARLMHLIWHRAELRTHDHPALDAAAQAGGRVVPLVVIDPHIFRRPTTTPRRQAWFLENVRALRASYRALGSDLIVREGIPSEVISAFSREHGVKRVHFIRNYTPYAAVRDEAVTRALEATQIAVSTYPGQHTHEPGDVLAVAGTPYSVFSGYSRAWFSRSLPSLVPRPRTLPPVPRRIARGEIPVAESDVALPPPGEEAATARLDEFLRDGQAHYAGTRDRPALTAGTSRLSMYFTLGILSPRLAVQEASDAKWRQELAWRDFHAEILARYPEGAREEYQARWRGFPWRRDHDDEQRWVEGRTGYPIVDAGMRELRATGFMHNRVRMVAASFLTKHLLIDWRFGEAAFRGLLLCGESAQNIGNWQWVAGCGFDAAPYFRIFNPVAQGERFDPEGEYVRRWIPELAGVSGRAIHRPWTVASSCAEYPPPIIDLGEGRDRFLKIARRFLR